MLIISGLLKLWFLNPIKINLHFETDLTVVLNAEQEHSAFREILPNTQKSLILLFHLNSRRIVHIHRILLHSRACPATRSELHPKFGTQSTFQDGPSVSSRRVKDTDPISKHGPARQLLQVAPSPLGTQGSPSPVTEARKAQSRSAAVPTLEDSLLI